MKKVFAKTFLIFICAALLAVAVIFAQDQKPAKVAGQVDLPADVAATVKQLKDSFDAVQRDKALIDQREKNIQALLAVQFNRACAKSKLDPDLYEWVDDLSGLRPKSNKTDAKKGAAPPD